MARGRKLTRRLTPGGAKHLIGLAKVIGPAVLPVVTPYALRAAGAIRNAYDGLRARRLGVDVNDLAAFSGKGGRLHARISGIADALTDLKSRDASADTATFVRSYQAPLARLTAIVRAAERMPEARRKAAHRAVAIELDRLEDELLRRLGG